MRNALLTIALAGLVVQTAGAAQVPEITTYRLTGTRLAIGQDVHIERNEEVTDAAVVVGGVAISGGRGTLWGAFIGLLLLACINPALTHLRVEAYWEKAIQGAIILLAVVADGLRRRKENFNRG